MLETEALGGHSHRHGHSLEAPSTMWTMVLACATVDPLQCHLALPWPPPERQYQDSSSRSIPTYQQTGCPKTP